FERVRPVAVAVEDVLWAIAVVKPQFGPQAELDAIIPVDGEPAVGVAVAENDVRRNVLVIQDGGAGGGRHPDDDGQGRGESQQRSHLSPPETLTANPSRRDIPV